MPLVIEDEATADLVEQLARRRGVSEQEAVREAVQAELAREARPSVPALLKRLWAENPMPPPTGRVADKAFFDELSGEP